MMVILVAHAKVERFEDPENAAYDRYTPRLHKHAASLIAEWVDAVLFANKKFRVTKENAGFNGERAIAAPIGADGGERIIRTVGSPACIRDRRSHRRGWRGTHHPHGGKPRLHREEPLRSAI